MSRAEIVRSMAWVVALLAGMHGGIASANDDVIAAAGHNSSAAGLSKPRAENAAPLLPYPRSVPCLPAEGQGQGGNHLSAAIASAGLLPCPLSVPCFTTEEDVDLPLRRNSVPASGIQTRIQPARRLRRVKTPAFRSASRPVTNRSNVRLAAAVEESAGPRGSAATPRGMALRDDAAYERRARILLSDVERKLDGVDRAQLNENNLQAYTKAVDFTHEGRKALRANDNLAAWAFAEKAQLLSANLGTTRN